MDNSKLEIDRNSGEQVETVGVSRSPSDEPMDQVTPVHQLPGENTYNNKQNQYEKK
jgi:hypothetical protein